MKPKTTVQLPYVIDHDVPIPAHRGDPGLGELMRSLKVGDSFVAPKNKRSSIVNVARRLSIKLLTRNIDGDQIRVWRMENDSQPYNRNHRAKLAIAAG